jgi:hypothetical protein
MKALSRLESFIQDLVERPAWLLTQRRLHPIEMAAALTRAMESDALPLADRVIVPDSYALRLHPDDFRQYGSVRRTLEREFADYLNRLVQERGLTVNAPADVMIAETGTVRPGTIDVTTRFSEHIPRMATIETRLTPPATVPAHHRSGAGARDGTGSTMIEVLDHDGAVLRSHPLRTGRLIIGRRSGSGLVLPDPEVSREHAEIAETGVGWSIRDLGSMNGTIVNGTRISHPCALHDGDLIEIGHARLRFKLGG